MLLFLALSSQPGASAIGWGDWMKRLLILLISFSAHASPSQDAINAAARAFYEQQHWNDDVNRFLQHYERQLTPKQKKWGGYIYEIANIINRQEIRFTWHFP